MVNYFAHQQSPASVRIIRLAQVSAKLDMSEAKVFDMIAKGIFPRPFQIVPGGRAVGWLESDVDQWIISRREKSLVEGAA
jgi:prophage regulatory protein